MESIISLQIWQICLAFFFLVVIILIMRIAGVGKEMEMLLASVRMTLQLVLAGFVLTYILANPSPWLSLLFLSVMELFAIYTVISRSKSPLSKRLRVIIALSMLVGTISSFAFLAIAVIQMSPWYNPRYFIPIAGMLIGNSMTGISLGVHRLTSEMAANCDFIRGALMLGATPKAASGAIVRTVFEASIIPTINSMLGMGIVFLPGMMTGQILSGTDPLLAIRYQIVIMIGIVGSVALTVALFAWLGYKTFFNDRAQLVIDT